MAKRNMISFEPTDQVMDLLNQAPKGKRSALINQALVSSGMCNMEPLQECIQSACILENMVQELEDNEISWKMKKELRQLWQCLSKYVENT